MKLTTFLKTIPFAQSYNPVNSMNMRHSAAKIIQSMDSPDIFMIHIRDVHNCRIFTLFGIADHNVSLELLEQIGLEKSVDYVILSSEDIFFNYEGLCNLVSLGDVYFSKNSEQYSKIVDAVNKPMAMLKKLSNIRDSFARHIAHEKACEDELAELYRIAHESDRLRQQVINSE